MWVTPNDGTSPSVAFAATTPQNAAGIRPLPPWSTASARSTAPARTAAPEPPDEPPAEYAGLIGFRGGPKALDSPVPAAPTASILSLPVIVPPASRMRSTTTASSVGVKETIRDALVV